MTESADEEIDEARAAALEVLLHNAHGPRDRLPRAAGWGYPEPYTRDLLICGLAALATGQAELIASLRRVLAMLSDNRSPRGHIPSLVDDADDRGASDTTPLFLLLLGLYRRVTGEADFRDDAAGDALTWMAYQSPSDRTIVAQLPTSDWRDEQWVLGFGLYVNALTYAALRCWGLHKRAEQLRRLMRRFTVTGEAKHAHVHEGLTVRKKPYYAFWSYKLFSNERFDLLGNALAILVGVAPPARAKRILAWVEMERRAMRERGELAVDLAPNLFPFVKPGDPEWSDRYAEHNRPGSYHNGGVWPFVCGFHVAAQVAAGRRRLARRTLEALGRAVRPAVDPSLAFGFNEYLRAGDGTPGGHDWQSWSAAMFLYADACVRSGRPLLFEQIRRW